MQNGRKRAGSRGWDGECRRSRTLEEETPMNRYGTPAASVQSRPGCGPGVEEALREQNRLLSELVCAVNGLTGAVLAAGRGRET